jgi:predicted aldo/keto reductase-like oxidoreductase
MDPIIFGDNQFFGVNHMSEEKGFATAMKFQDTSKIIETLDMAYECGIHAFTFSTHDRVHQICDHFRANPQKYSDLRLYPVLPYAYKYAHSVNEKGIVGTIKDEILSRSTASQTASMVARGGAVIINRNPIEVMKILVDVEMMMFRDLNVKIIFLQNVVVDLLLGIGVQEVFSEFASYVEQKYGVRAGFMTRNMPRLVDVLLESGIERPVVCSAINKVGFQMNPDIASYEETLQTKEFDALAMSILAAGAVPPEEAIKYVMGLKNVKSVLFGASTKQHMEHTKSLIDKYCQEIYQWKSKRH